MDKEATLLEVTAVSEGENNQELLDAIGFFFMGPYQVTGLCQQASNFRRPQSQHPMRNCQRSDRNVCQSGGKLGPKNRPL